MRISIALALAATVALFPAPLMAQATNDTNAATAAAPAPDTVANSAATVPPADNSMVMANDMMPVEDITVAEETFAEPAAPRSSRAFPWGVLGLLGLIGLLGRRRSSS